MTSADAYPPRDVAERVLRVGVVKACQDAGTLLVLAVLAGAFIGLGAIFFAVVVTGPTLGPGPTRLLGALAFCLGLTLVVVAGAELFTGNNLVAMAWASRLIRGREVLRSWAIVYAGIGIVLPITAFVVVGFEHSIANMFLLPYATTIDGPSGLLPGTVLNIAVVTLGTSWAGRSWWQASTGSPTCERTHAQETPRRE